MGTKMGIRREVAVASNSIRKSLRQQDFDTLIKIATITTRFEALFVLEQAHHFGRFLRFLSKSNSNFNSCILLNYKIQCVYDRYHKTTTGPHWEWFWSDCLSGSSMTPEKMPSLWMILSLWASDLSKSQEQQKVQKGEVFQWQDWEPTEGRIWHILY